MTHTYKTASAFKQALEQRLRASSASSLDLARQRQLVVFDRFLARLALSFGDAVTLKGGLAVELRLARARTTKDVDLRMLGAPDDMLGRLHAAVRCDMNDFMTFIVRRDPRHPDIQHDGVQYDGQRFRAECRVAGKVYGSPFGVDVAMGDPILGEPDIMVARDVLGFAGIAPPTLRVYPIETHLAEKLHAYTMPRTRPNTRVKDLPDLALIATAGPLAAQRLRAAFAQTFSFRGTHPVPHTLPLPPVTWQAPYASIAQEGSLPWHTLEEVIDAASAFINPVLHSQNMEIWAPDTWRWRP